MLWYTARRLGAAVVVLVSISIMVFLMFFATPGMDPASRIAGRNASPQTLAQVRAEFGLNQPIWIQYLKMMQHLFINRDLASFINRGQRVIPEIDHALPVTLSLSVGAAIIWLAFGIGMGVIAARWKGTLVDPLIMLLGVFGVSLPVYWLSEVANLVTQGSLHQSVFRWVPPPGYVPLTQNPFEWALHLMFPCLTLAVLYAGIYARVMRGELLTALSEDYVRTARSKGLSENRILFKHALRCSLIPIVSMFGLDFGTLVGGAALLTEIVFGLPGIGMITWESLQGLDLPVILGTVMYAAFFVVLANALVDILYAKLDPRVSHA